MTWSSARRSRRGRTRPGGSERRRRRGVAGADLVERPAVAAAGGGRAAAGSGRPRAAGEHSSSGLASSPSRYHQSRYHGLNLNSLFFRGTIEFRLFNGTLHAGEVKAYIQLVLALAANALSSKAASSKRRDFDPATAKYDFRVVLLRLGLIGDEFKTARLHLTKRLAGSAAWKRERRDRTPPAPTHTASTNDEPLRAAA